MTRPEDERDARRDEIVGRILATGTPTDDPELAELIERDHTLLEEAEAVLEVERALEERDVIRRADLAAAASLGSSMDVEDVLEVIDRSARAQPRGVIGGRTGTTGRWIALAAALLLVAWLAWPGGSDVDRPATWNRFVRMGAPVEYVAPKGEVVDLTYFEWNGELQPGETFVVVVYDGNGVEIERSVSLTEPTWTCEALSDVSEPIEWQVFVIDAGENAVSAPLQRAWRR